MLRILGNPKRTCDGLTRRDLLVASGLGALAAVGAAAAGPPRRAKSVICLFLFGGWSQLDTFDPKPDAPAEVRGPYRPIASAVPGVRVCEHLPRLARRLDRVAVVRSVRSDDANHNTSRILTGHQATVGGTAVKGINPGIRFDHPFFLSALQYLRERGGAPAALPRHVCVPNRLGLLEGYHRTGPYGGFLGARYDPVCTRVGTTGELLYQPGGVQPRTLEFAPAGLGVTLDALDRRAGLLRQLEQRRRLESPAAERYADRRQEAFRLATSGRLRRALDLRAEPPALRDRYGWNLFGQSCLLARRLVEAGVPLVTAVWDCTKESNDIATLGWDTHWDHFKACQGWLLPGLDAALAALLDDLEARGLLDETLVVCLSEMGRTPRINARAGRDHWVGSYCALYAGAGVRRGVVHGRSDRLAAEVREDPVSTQDLLATVYHLCGVGADTMIHDHLRRPLPLYGEGRPIRAVLA